MRSMKKIESLDLSGLQMPRVCLKNSQNILSRYELGGLDGEVIEEIDACFKSSLREYIKNFTVSVPPDHVGRYVRCPASLSDIHYTFKGDRTETVFTGTDHFNEPCRFSTNPYARRLYMSEGAIAKILMKLGVDVYCFYDQCDTCADFVIPYARTNKPLKAFGTSPYERYGRSLMDMDISLSDWALALWTEAEAAIRSSDFDKVYASLPRMIRDVLADASFPWFGTLEDMDDWTVEWPVLGEDDIELLARTCPKKRRTASEKEPRGYPSGFKMCLWETRDHTCALCGKLIEDYSDCEIDHIVPYSRGGKTVPENAQLTHRQCNRSKGSKIS